MARLWSVLTARGPEKGTASEIAGRYIAALVVGLVFWWVRSKS